MPLWDRHHQSSLLSSSSSPCGVLQGKSKIDYLKSAWTPQVKIIAFDKAAPSDASNRFGSLHAIHASVQLVINLSILITPFLTLDNSLEQFTELRKTLYLQLLQLYYRGYESELARCTERGLGGSWMQSFHALFSWSQSTSPFQNTDLFANQGAPSSSSSRVFTGVLLHRHDWLNHWSYVWAHSLVFLLSWWSGWLNGPVLLSYDWFFWHDQTDPESPR